MDGRLAVYFLERPASTSSINYSAISGGLICIKAAGGEALGGPWLGTRVSVVVVVRSQRRAEIERSVAPSVRILELAVETGDGSIGDAAEDTAGTASCGGYSCQ